MSHIRDLALPLKSTNVRKNIPPVVRYIGWGLRVIDRFAPTLATSLAARLFLVPRRLRRPDSEQPWADAARSEVRTIAGMQVMVRSWGSGKPLLLIHGWEGRGTQLGAIASVLATRGYEVIAPDLPAHGDSPGSHTDLLEFAAVVAELIRTTHPAGIVAHSFGAAATNVALREAPFDGRLVYLSPPEDFRFFTLTFASMLGIPEDLALRMERKLERRFGVEWSQLRGAAIAPQMTAPLLVIHDEDDQDVPARYGRALAAAWPGSELMVTTGLGHRRILRDDGIIEAAIAFLERDVNRA